MKIIAWPMTYIDFKTKGLPKGVSYYSSEPYKDTLNITYNNMPGVIVFKRYTKRNSLLLLQYENSSIIDISMLQYLGVVMLNILYKLKR